MDKWPEIEAFVRHMCQVAHESPAYTALLKVNEMMPKLREKFEAAVDSEREAEADFRRDEF